MVIKRNMSRAKEVMALFSAAQNKIDSNKKEREEKSHKSKISSGRYNDLTSKDLVWVFSDAAHKAKVYFRVSSKELWGKYKGIFNKLIKDEVSPQDIVNMINFLFESEQTYLDKRKLSPTIFSTGWFQKIYVDTSDWLEGSYSEESKKNVREKKKGEWSDDEGSYDIG